MAEFNEDSPSDIVAERLLRNGSRLAASDPQVAEDAVYGVREELLSDFRERQDRGGKRAWVLDFTFVLARSRNGRRPS